MDSITLKNFRCFREEQTARLAPLTLLVGENSTGKTSFMAMIRALWDVAYRRTDPDFKEEPYDLGSFDEIAHHRGGRAGRASTFQVGFSATRGVEGGKNAATPSPYRFDITFERQGPAATPTSRRFSRDDAWVEEDLQYDEWPPRLSLGTPNGAWMGEVDPELEHEAWPFDVHPGTMENTDGTEAPTTTDWEQLRRLSQTANKVKLFGRRSQRPYASAPVRSKPRRTYDPSRPTPDPEGDYVPMYLAEVFLQDKREWKGLKNALEAFGRQSGLFDEISVKSFGTKGSEPFQVQVRKFSEKVKGAKGPRRNLIDVGYGVSQVLPVIIELVRRDFLSGLFDNYRRPSVFLLQQPEVHLHPSAQAALGSLFCHLAGPKRQLIVETHSDHMLDRVRMDVRDGKTRLRPEDVSILFFERGDLDVQIHSLRIDLEGNIVSAPDTYRSFFMNETRRSLGL